jgi:hypothetical protein
MNPLQVIERPRGEIEWPTERPASNYERLVEEGALLPLDEYDVIICNASGGKDSIAQGLHIAELCDQYGADRSQIESWHQCIAGDPMEHAPFMDWPITESYTKRVAEALGHPLYYQWKVGGFEGEMLKENSIGQGVGYEDKYGERHYLPPMGRKLSTRRKFPQKGADLRTRWCSAYLKIDVFKRVLNNDIRFARAKILDLTGERREESPNRANYEEAIKHASNGQRRRVDQWRSVIDWKETDVWNIIREYGVVPHPGYRLGWGRLSCLACIFGHPNQWASVRDISPKLFQKIADYEKEFDCTIDNKRSVVEMADKGTSYLKNADPKTVALAMQKYYPVNQVLCLSEDWELPAGAFSKCGGPS